MAEYTQVDDIDADWTNPDNWDPASVAGPVDGDTVIFTDNTLGDLTVNAPGAAVTLNVQVSGDFAAKSIVANLLGNNGAHVGTVRVSDDTNPVADVILDYATPGEITITNAGGAATLRLKAATAFTPTGAVTLFVAGAPLGTSTLMAAGAGAVLNGDVTGAGAVDWGSGNLTINGSFEALGGMDHQNCAGATLTINKTSTLDLDTSGDVANLALVLTGAAAVTITAGDTVNVKTLTCTSANVTYIDNGSTHNIAGDITFTAGTLTSTGIWTQTATGNVNTNSNAARTVFNLVLGSAGVVSTLTGPTRCDRFTYGAGTVDLAGFTLSIYPSASNFWTTGTGTFQDAGSGAGVVVFHTGNKSLGRMDTGNVPIEFLCTASPIITMTGALSCGTGQLVVNTLTDNGLQTLDMNNQPLTAGAVKLGRSDSDILGGILLLRGGVHKLTSIAKAKAAATVANAVNMGSCYLELRSGGSIDAGAAGTAIAFTNTAAHVVGAGVAPTLNRIVIGAGEKLHAHNCTDGGTNTNVDFDTHVAPGNPGLP